MQKFNCCKATRIRRRLISVAHVTSLGYLRRKPSSFENFGCRYCTAFASISSNRKRGSFDSEGLECGIDRLGRENPVSCRKPRFAGEKFESKWRLYRFPWLNRFVSQNIWLGSNNFDVKRARYLRYLYRLIAKAGSHLSHMKRDMNLFKSNSIACCLHYLMSLMGILSRYLFILTNFDSLRRHTHATIHALGKQEFRAKWCHLIHFFLQGKQVELLFSHWLLPQKT